MTANSLPSAIGACQDKNGAAQVWAAAGGTLNTRLEPAGSSAWTPPEVFTPQPSGPPGYPVNAIAAGLLAFGDIGLFAAVPDLVQHIGRLISCRQKLPDHQAFTGWSPVAGAPDLNEFDPVVAVGTLPDTRLQLWVGSSSGQELFTCWEQSTLANSPWTAWKAVAAPDQGVVFLACGTRPDGHVQLWAIDRGMGLVTAVQAAAPPSAGALSWSAQPLPAGVGSVAAVAVGKLSGSRLQLFIAVDSYPKVDVYTCWSQGGGYSPWVQLPV
jgi:hypothetical protein